MTEIRGRLQALGCADTLEFLRSLNRTGLVTFVSEETRVGLYLRGGRLAHATSTRASDRLPDRLVEWGFITRAECDDAMRRADAGARLGRALLSNGRLSARRLMEARERLVRQVAVSLFEWEEGEYAFLEGDTPPDAEVEVDLSITSILLEGIRSVRNLSLFQRRLPIVDWVFESIQGNGNTGDGIPLDPHEAYVLRLVDGTRSLGEIASTSEFGPEETLRTLFLLSIVGLVKNRPPTAVATDEDDADDVHGILLRYNGMFGRVYERMMLLVGPIAEHLLARSLRETSALYPTLFHRTTLLGDGTVDAEMLRGNLGSIAARRRETLVQGLNELLYSELLVLRKTLGPEHEARLLRDFGDIRWPRAEGSGGA